MWMVCAAMRFITDDERYDVVVVGGCVFDVMLSSTIDA